MPSGKIHNDINQTVFLGMVFLMLFFIPDIKPVLWYFVLGFGIGVNYLNCDLDKNNTRPDQNWGRWGRIWDIYAWLMPHRGRSHALYGFITRYIFILIVIFLSYLVYNFMDIFLDKDIPLSRINFIILIDNFGTAFNSFIEANKDKIIPITAGIFTADVFHIVEDAIL